MQNNANSQQSAQNSPWWHSTRDGLGERIRRINKIKDPNTSTDEVLRGANVLIVILLVFTGTLGGLSYFKFFSQSFSVELAALLAIALTYGIEWSKNKAAKWAVRLPLFQGWRHIWHLPENSIMWVGCLLIALATFGMSVYNSTKGSRQLSLMLSQEKNHTTFQPNTTDIDAQIATTQSTITNAPMGKWKGRMYYQEPRVVRAAQKTVESLQRQRETAIAQQRADWEANRDLKQGNANFAAKAVLAAGGWVELLQVLFIFLIVACEKKLDGRQQSPTPDRKTVAGFNPGVEHAQDITAEYRPIGFNLDRNGNVKSAAITEDVVMKTAGPQHPETYGIETTTYGIANTTVASVGADQVLKLLRQNLIREIPNLTDRNANPSTVSGRINRHLDEAGMLMSQAGFLPTHAVAIQVYQYLADKAFPTLNERGWPYDREQAFCRRLLAVIGSTRTGEGA